MTQHPSMDHLVRHQRNLDEYKHNVRQSAEGRFGPAWWGAWDQRVNPAPDASIVDLGSGSGHWLSQARQRMPHARLVGVDVHPEMLAMARAHLEGSSVELVEADLGGSLPFRDASFDVVVSTLTFHELPHPPDLLANAGRILRGGGRLILFDIVKFPLAHYMEGKRVNRDSLDHFREHCLFTADDLAWLVRQAGFSVEEVTVHNGRFATVHAVRESTEPGFAHESG